MARAWLAQRCCAQIGTFLCCRYACGTLPVESANVILHALSVNPLVHANPRRASSALSYSTHSYELSTSKVQVNYSERHAEHVLFAKTGKATSTNVLHYSCETR